MTLASIDWGKLLELVWAAVLAGVGVGVAFSLLILGAVRAADARRAEHGVAATAYMALAAVAGIAVMGSVVFGISVIVSK